MPPPSRTSSLTRSRQRENPRKSRYSRLRRKANGAVEDAGRVGRAKRDRSEIIELVFGPPEEVEAVRTAYRMARDGSGYRSIASYFNDHGIPSPDVERAKTNATAPGRWCATTIRGILLQSAYASDAI